jgi:hypothetical protein
MGSSRSTKIHSCQLRTHQPIKDLRVARDTILKDFAVASNVSCVLIPDLESRRFCAVDIRRTSLPASGQLHTPIIVRVLDEEQFTRLLG